MLNAQAAKLFDQTVQRAESIRVDSLAVANARVIDAGISTPGSLEAGLILARLCMGDRADISICPATDGSLAASNLIHVRTDHPLEACLGSQYAGWPVQTDSFFAMGSGPMRLLRGREEMLKELALSESGQPAVGVLEADRLPDESVIELIAQQCDVAAADIHLAIAPSTSIAGGLQVVARSIETALHKLHELEFDVRTIVSGTGVAPLPPPSKPGDMVGGIGRTNDAMLYGATVTLWADCEDDRIEAVSDKVPSRSSADYGQPFAKVFKQYDYDFYKVDPLLFSPAVVTIHNLKTGRTWSAGKIATDVLQQSFHA